MMTMMLRVLMVLMLLRGAMPDLPPGGFGVGTRVKLAVPERRKRDRGRDAKQECSNPPIHDQRVEGGFIDVDPRA